MTEEIELKEKVVDLGHVSSNESEKKSKLSWTLLVIIVVSILCVILGITGISIYIHTPEYSKERHYNRVVLVTTGLMGGDGRPSINGKLTEIIDLKGTRLKCNLPEFPIRSDNAIGGLINKSEIVICGGVGGK